MPDFADLVRSRKEWIADVLIPWCRSAPLADLRKAEEEWLDIAGKVAPQLSLWLWAWSRFPVLYVEGLPGLEETHRVRVTLDDQSVLAGFPDARKSQRGQLVLLLDGSPLRESPPLPIDRIRQIERLLDS